MIRRGLTGTEDLVSLVLTYPGLDGGVLAAQLDARTTHGTLIELVATANRSLLIASPYLFLARGLEKGVFVNALEAAIERGVTVDLITSRESARQLGAPFALLAARRAITVLLPAPNAGVSALAYHAKVIVADENAAYVGSANLTTPGIQEQVELGVRLQGKIVDRISRFYRYMIEIGYLVHLKDQDAPGHSRLP